MNNFTYYNPVKIVFGKGTISELTTLIPKDEKALIVYGGGSIKKNGVYDQVVTALADHTFFEFSGIEPNPDYATCMQVVELTREKKIDFLLAVGGGSVIDAVKFIAAASRFDGGDPWDILSKHARVTSSLPLGVVLTLPATGSEMNSFSVISRRETGEKLPFGSPYVYPQFSILDPETTYSLPERQVANGIVDAFVHVLEQYLTVDINTPLQDRQAEAILLTLVEQAKIWKNKPQDYDNRANIMWTATNALNGLIGAGVVHDWATHSIGHELTALHGIDHARTLAVIAPVLLAHQKNRKHDKLLQFGERVWGVTVGTEEELIEKTITTTRAFFKSLDVPVRLRDYDVPESTIETVAAIFEKRGQKLGEHQAIGPEQVKEILALAW